MKELEKRIGYTYKNISYLENALTHSSYANEVRHGVKSNERLEFLGDDIKEGALAHAVGSHDTYLLTFFNIQGKIVYDFLVFSVSEADVIKYYFIIECCKLFIGWIFFDIHF